MAIDFELHFQEGFHDDDVEASVGGRIVSRGVLSTRQQIGLAKIERFVAASGDELTIRLMRSGVQRTIALTETKPFIRVNQANDRVTVEVVGTSPGYV